jgi:hypothetical protein
MAALGLTFLAHGAHAQQDLEPAVQTSHVAPAPAAAAPSAAAASSVAPGTAAVPPPASAPAGVAGAPAKGAPAKGAKPNDSIQLDTTQISGNRELPKVMYVVPWRRPDPGEFSGRPPNSLLDEALTPVDRDVFRRQNRYYSALSGEPGAGEPGASNSQPGAAGTGMAAPTPKDEK